jgi:hypothetical protein
LLFPNSYTILFWEFYYLPFSVHVKTNTFYVTWLFCYGRCFNNCLSLLTAL